MIDNPLNTILDAPTSEFLCRCLGATEVWVDQHMQTLWGGQGQLLRLGSDSQSHSSSVLKQIILNADAGHPRGWNSDTSFQRKKKSYEVERCWYENYSQQCGEACKVPLSLGTNVNEAGTRILMEDLSLSYPICRDQLSVEEAFPCLDWLAGFHAKFMGSDGQGLWDQGCYWHLDTRQDEFAVMAEGSIKTVAQSLDSHLKNTRHQTLVHGDAKLANFCFNSTMDRVSAVDFQYVGKGCGIKDVVYFLGSCLSSDECSQYEQMLLGHYFSSLDRYLQITHTTAQICEIKQDWLSLYAIAWTDFYRFLLGWMPAHGKINAYTKSLSERALAELKDRECNQL